MKKENIVKLVNAVIGYECDPEAINEKELLNVIKNHLSKNELFVISNNFGLFEENAKKLEEIPLGKICAAGVYPTRANLRRLKSTALTKLGKNVLLRQYYNPLP